VRGSTGRAIVFVDFLRAFFKNRRANVALTFALAAIPLVAMVGMAVDIANAMRARLALEDATDSAALSLARQSASIADSAISSTAKAYVDASYNVTAGGATITSATIDRSTITATIDDRVNVPTYFASLVGVPSLPVSAHAVAKGLLLEIALVLDTSGSMSQSAGSGGSKISALKTASGNFLDAMFGTQATSQRVSVGIVPFSTSVRVLASGSAPPAWMDTTGLAPDAFDDLDSRSKTRFQLFSSMQSQSWGGCVMTRPSPYDVSDDAPTTATPATLFVPWFAPDEPDANPPWPQTAYENDYISDTGGTCTGSITGMTDVQKEARACKYSGAKAASGLGPNYLCDSTALTPLTSTRATLNSAINALQANGDTNIMEGVMWGWRVLSPGAPFTEGKPYGAPNNRKVIVLMTDGVNNYNGVNNPNMSYYFTYGFAKDGRIGQVTSDNTTLTSLLNSKTLQACANAKAQGIMIYTIGFGAGATGSTSLLQSCATDPKYAYFPKNSSDLVPVFQKIAQSINSLRIAE
jgi:Flp pilus assembly protein TadG